MAKTVLCFVGHLPAKDMPNFLENKKTNYLGRGSELCINVISSVVHNHGQIAEKVKAKNPNYLILDQIPAETASAIQKAVSKKCSNPPTIFESPAELENHLRLN